MTIRRALSCRAPAARGIRELHVAQKIAFFDIGLIVDIIVFERERIIREQQEADHRLERGEPPLAKTVTAARLMGAHVIVSSLSSAVAESLFALGIELSKLNTVGDLHPRSVG
jgi:hypothetical protein